MSWQPWYISNSNSAAEYSSRENKQADETVENKVKDRPVKKRRVVSYIDQDMLV